MFPEFMVPNSSGRTNEQVRRHFEVEREIANRLKAADREGRKEIFRTMYDELFALVPDHPRLVRREDPARTQRAIRRKLALLKPFIKATRVFLEFAPGDCRFAFEMSKHAKKVYGVDISDQTGNAIAPQNFELVLYNGYDLDIPEGSVEVVFSDQLIEHIHPEDTAFHFALVKRILRPGGAYVFTTPHSLTGPHDVSVYFCSEAECFHLKEWTYEELVPLIRKSGYRSIAGYWFAKGLRMRVPLWLFAALERFARKLPYSSRRKYLRYVLPSVTIAAYV